MRNFAVERMLAIPVTQKAFTPPAGTGGVPFGDSVGVNDGTPERVELEFCRTRRALRARVALARFTAAHGPARRRARLTMKV